MKYVIISGSHRENSQSEKVSKWLLRQLEKRGNQVNLLNLAHNPFPFWDESFWEEGSQLQKDMQPTTELLSSADGLIIVSPEWGGMVPAGIKNLLLFLDKDSVGHKPCLLVGVSSNKGGSYPIVELRMSGYKNTKMCYIPDHLIVREVEGVMNDDLFETDNKADAYIKKRALFSLDVLETYTKAFVPIRENKEIFNDTYEFGM
jgi:hypothetical protein